MKTTMLCLACTLGVLLAQAQAIKKTTINIKDSVSEETLVLIIADYMQDSLDYGIASRTSLNPILTDSIFIDSIQVSLRKFLWIFPRDPQEIAVFMKHEIEVDMDPDNEGVVGIQSFVCVPEGQEIYKKKINSHSQKYANQLRRDIKAHLAINKEE